MNAKRVLCKKCGRRLTDPVSIAVGVGPGCRGESHPGSCRSPRTRSQRSSAQAYAGVQIARRTRAEALATGRPIAVGIDTRTKEPILYTPDNDGNYINSQTGGTITAPALLAWMIKYGLLTPTNSVAPNAASEAFIEVRQC